MIPEPVSDFDPQATDYPGYHLGASAVLIVGPHGDLLLQRRTEGYSRPGMVNFFGGGHEPDETFLQTALRELHEETGAIIMPGELRLIGASTRMYRKMSVRGLIGFFLWHDRDEQVTRAYEGELAHFADVESVLACETLSFSSRWAIGECVRQNLL